MQLPDSENSWTWDNWTEWDARMTDPGTGTFGSWVRDDYVGQYLPQMYTNGLKKPDDDGLTKTAFDQPEATDSWTYLLGKLFDRKTSPTTEEARLLAGEDETPFAAGKFGIWPTNRVVIHWDGHSSVQWPICVDAVARSRRVGRCDAWAFVVDASELADRQRLARRER